MKPIELPEGVTLDYVKVKVQAEKRAAVEYQQRRHKQWDENYALYRDKVEVNSLTQRQQVNVPLMKETVKTVLSKIDEEPDVTLKDNGGDEDKEVIMQEKWAVASDYNQLDIQDIVLKKQMILYGRAHVQHNWKQNNWKLTTLDIYDLVVDPKTNPLDIQTANHLHRLKIYKHLRDILEDKDYDQEQRNILSGQLADQVVAQTPIASSADISARNERLRTLGASDLEIANVGAEQMMELNLHFTKVWDKNQAKFVKYVVTTAVTGVVTGEYDNLTILRAQRLEDEIGLVNDMGEELWPFDTCADDVDPIDYWTDGIADTVRTPNKLINSWLSQLTENRTFRNFHMNFYDSTVADNWTPTGYLPMPFAWYPLPGKPDDVYKEVKIDPLTDVIQEIQFVIGLVEKATATGAVDKGVLEQGKRTLGEIEIAVTKSMERTTSMAKYYKRTIKNMVQKWVYLEYQNRRGGEKLSKLSGISGQVVQTEVTRDQWYSEEGYKIIVESFSQQMTEKAEQIQRLGAAKQFFNEGNIPLKKAIQKRVLGIVDLNPEEKQEILQAEEQLAQVPQILPGQEGQEPPTEEAPTGIPPELAQAIAGAV